MSEPTSTQLQIFSDNQLTEMVVDKVVDYSTTVEVNESDFSVAPDANTNYYSRARHSDINGSSPWSDIVNFTIASSSYWNTFTSGVTIEFGGYTGSYPNVLKLDTNKYLLVYASGGVYAQYIEYDGTDVTAQDPIQCSSTDAGYVNAILMDDGRVVVVYTEIYNDNYIRAHLLSINHTTKDITVVTNGASIAANGGDHLVVIKTNTNRLIYCFRSYNDNNYLHSGIITISGDTFVSTATVQCTTITAANIALDLLDVDTCLVSFSSNGIYAIVLNNSGSNVVAGVVLQLTSDSSQYTGCVALNTTTGVIFYTNSTISNSVQAVLVTISGTTITPQSPVLCNDFMSSHIDAIKVANNTILLSYLRVDHSNFIYSQLIKISGTVVFAEAYVQVTEVPAVHAKPTMVSDDKVFMVYSNEDSWNRICITEYVG